MRKIIFIIFLIAMLSFGLLGCASGDDAKDDDAKEIKSGDEAIENTDEVVDGLSDVSTDIEDLEDIVS